MFVRVVGSVHFYHCRLTTVVLTGRKHDLTACKLFCQERCHRWYLRLVSWVPPETFQFVTFISNDNKDAEYTCFCYKKHVKWSVSVFGMLINNLRKCITNEIYIFCMVDSEIL